MVSSSIKLCKILDLVLDQMREELDIDGSAFITLCLVYHVDFQFCYEK